MPNRIPIDALQQALYTKLSTDLGTLVPAVPVYSFFAPQDAEYPFAVISQFSATPDDTKGSEMQEMAVTIEIFSRSKSATQLNAALNKSLESCSGARLTLADNFTDIGLGRQEVAEAFATFDELGIVMHGILKYQWAIEDVA